MIPNENSRPVCSDSIRNWHEFTPEHKRVWARKFLGRIKEAAAPDDDPDAAESDGAGEPTA